MHRPQGFYTLPLPVTARANAMSIPLSQRSQNVLQSEIRSMTRECRRVNGINMAQGVCDLPIPPPVIAAAHQAIDTGYNSYSAPEGLPGLREAIAARMNVEHAMTIQPAWVMVSQGATGAFHATAQAVLDPGDEVILFEPYYGYHAATLHALGCSLRYVRMSPPDWPLPQQALEAAIGPRTRAIVISNPSNPSGKVYQREELEWLGQLCQRHKLVLFSDEIYEHFVYDGRVHIPPATLPALRERTITLSGFSKIFSITGWRLGYAIAPPEVIEAASRFNDLIYVCAPTPLQQAAIAGLTELDNGFYRQVCAEHAHKRQLFCDTLARIGLPPAIPQGAYYVMADVSSLPGKDDRSKAMHILQQTGIASVPGRAFYHDHGGAQQLRFCFAKREDALAQACRRLESLGRA